MAATTAVPVEPAAESRRLTVQFAPYTYHYSWDPEHNVHTRLLGLEWEARPKWFTGTTTFRNSFSQSGQYIYAGRRWPLASFSENAYFKLSGGLLLGYRPPYDDKIPLNHRGIALAAVPAFGYQYGWSNIQFNILGTAGFVIRSESTCGHRTDARIPGQDLAKGAGQARISEQGCPPRRKVARLDQSNFAPYADGTGCPSL